MPDRCYKTEEGRICFPPVKNMAKKKTKKKTKKKKKSLALGECRLVEGRPQIEFCRTGKGLTGYQFKSRKKK